MGSKGRPETSVRNYQCTLRNIAEEGRYDLLGSESQTSREPGESSYSRMDPRVCSCVTRRDVCNMF
jgi:hypothetical protein